MARRKKSEEIVEEVITEDSVTNESVIDEVPVEDSLDIADPIEDTGADRSITVDSVEGDDTPNFDESNENVETPIVEEVTEPEPIVEEKSKKKSAKKVSVKKEESSTENAGTHKKETKKEATKVESEMRTFVGKKVYRSKAPVSVMFNNFIGVVKVIEEDNDWITIEVYNRATNGYVLGYIKK